MNKREYDGPMVNAMACSYAKLDNYNKGVPSMSPPVPDFAKDVIGYNVVPVGMYRKPNLTHGNSCSGYANIMGAYGKNAGNCAPKYRIRKCEDMDEEGY